MAMRNSTRSARAVDPDIVTPAHQRAAQAALRKDGGAHAPIPANKLAGGSPAEIIWKCRVALEWFYRIEADTGATVIVESVTDALARAERIIREIGANPDSDRILLDAMTARAAA